MTILAIIFPIVAIALCGYVIAYRQILSAADIQGISRFVFTILIPVLLFDAMAHIELPEQFNWPFLLSYYGVMFVIFAAGFLIARYWFQLGPQGQAIFGMGSSYSNLVLVGLPLVSAGLGEVALLPYFMIISLHSATQFFTVMILAERGQGDGQTAGAIALQTVKNLGRNPIISGLVLGLLANVLAIPLPAPLEETLDIIGRATLPCALFVLGASLNGYKVVGHLQEAGFLIGLKMILQPFLVWVLAFGVFGIDPLWGSVAVMAAGMPIGVNAYIFAQKYQVVVPALSTAVLLSTLLAIVTQSLLLALFMA